MNACFPEALALLVLPATGHYDPPPPDVTAAGSLVAVVCLVAIGLSGRACAGAFIGGLLGVLISFAVFTHAEGDMVGFAFLFGCPLFGVAGLILGAAAGALGGWLRGARRREDGSPNDKPCQANAAREPEKSPAAAPAAEEEPAEPAPGSAAGHTAARGS